MFRSILTAVMTATLIFTACGVTLTRAQTRDQSQPAEQARARVQKIGVGRDARVEVKLRDNTKLKGYVSAAAGDSFTVTDAKTGAARTVDYAEVARVKKPGGGLSTRTLLI